MSEQVEERGSLQEAAGQPARTQEEPQVEAQAEAGPVGGPSWLERPLTTLWGWSWEGVAWAVLLAVSAVARFYQLGVRAMSHDESLHALYSYYLYNSGNYEHNPMMHGPLLFHLNALVYFLFGDNDATARLMPALAGIGVVWMAWWFRPYLGRVGALVTGVLLSLSPSLLFHSRYIRNDIYIALFTLIWIYGAFRYLDATTRSQRNRWLTVMVLGMLLGFITKENHFMTGAIIGAFFVGLALWQVIDYRLFYVAAPALLGGSVWFFFHAWALELSKQARSLANTAAQQSQQLTLQSEQMDRLGLIGLGLGGLVALGFLLFAMRREQWQQLRHNPVADLAVVMLTLVLPFTSPFLYLIGGWEPIDWSRLPASLTGPILARYAVLVVVVTVLAFAVAYFWFALRKPGGDGVKGVWSPESEVRSSKSEVRRSEDSGLRTSDSPPEDGPPLLGFGDWLRVMGLFWIVAILFFTTFLTNTRNGLATGLVGSLGYWLAQQEVQRGSQPWYYYIMLGWLYEFLPIILAGGGMVTVLLRLWRGKRWDPLPAWPFPGGAPGDGSAAGASAPSGNGREAMTAIAPGLAERSRLHRIYFVVFCCWWVVAAWAAYTIAGEKMPWLLTHIALPMCVLGGWWLGRLIQQLDWQAVPGGLPRVRAGWLVGATPALIFVLFTLATSRPSLDRSLVALGETVRWLLALGLGAGLVYWILGSVRAIGIRPAARLLGLGFVGLLFLLTVRFSYMLTYVNYDLVTEYLVYAHGSPGIKQALREIDLISQRTVGDRNITVAYDDDSSWPLSWYMRLYPNSRFYGSNPTSDAMNAPVVIVGPKNLEKVAPYVERDYVRRTYQLVWWPDQGYFGFTWQRFLNTITDREKMKRIFDIVFYRRFADDANPGKPRPLSQWPNRHDFYMYVRRDIAASIWDLSVVPVTDRRSEMEALLAEREVDLSATAVYADVYGGQPLLQPRALAVGPNGERVIADTGNHRIVVLDAGGAFVRAFGSLCRLSEGAAGGCVDPDGDGPLALGDGQFYEPWGVAVGSDGTLFVADTWNGRIQAFDPEGNFIRKWGLFNTTNGELGDPYALFGPRGVAVNMAGNLLVSDTGNKRILEFTPTGELVRQVGGGGAVLGRFEEPVGVAVDPRDGSVYVADAWNRRIQKLDAALQPLAEWEVPGWESQQIYHKPYIAVAGNGDVYITDPENYRVIVYNTAGGIQAVFGDYGVELNRFGLPNGIAYDPGQNQILVADADNNRVLVFPALGQ
ncbi:MAG: hypothetical protein KatS3mg050_4511 [Litorilinea sp.]|nr:MAG: hypothetical protein KatS3mg050_4511 [Litorilinea sp.]